MDPENYRFIYFNYEEAEFVEEEWKKRKKVFSILSVLIILFAFVFPYLPHRRSFGLHVDTYELLIFLLIQGILLASVYYYWIYRFNKARLNGQKVILETTIVKQGATKGANIIIQTSNSEFGDFNIRRPESNYENGSPIEIEFLPKSQFVMKYEVK